MPVFPGHSRLPDLSRQKAFRRLGGRQSPDLYKRDVVFLATVPIKNLRHRSEANLPEGNISSHIVVSDADGGVYILTAR